MFFNKIHYTQISSSIAAYFASPIPDTFFSSSMVLNFPFLFLYSIIFNAVDGPIPC